MNFLLLACIFIFFCERVFLGYKAKIFFSLFIFSILALLFSLFNSSNIVLQTFCAFWMAVQFAALFCHFRNSKILNKNAPDDRAFAKKIAHEIRKDIAPAVLLIDYIKTSTSSTDQDALEKIDVSLSQVVKTLKKF
jgi:hypothetical protein